jgi:hypothetical protein
MIVAVPAVVHGMCFIDGPTPALTVTLMIALRDCLLDCFVGHGLYVFNIDVCRVSLSVYSRFKLSVRLICITINHANLSFSLDPALQNSHEGLIKP